MEKWQAEVEGTPTVARTKLVPKFHEIGPDGSIMSSKEVPE